MYWMISTCLYRKMRMLANSELLSIIQKRVCHTDLVYQRVNKKLKVNLFRTEIGKLVQDILSDDQTTVEKWGRTITLAV